MNKIRLIGPFAQIVTMDSLPLKGPLTDDRLEIIDHAGILVNGDVIEAVGPFRELKSLTSAVEPVDEELTLIPGMVDVHTHICWAGSRAGDYAMRLSGKTYLEIAQYGGGIWSTVAKTREASLVELARLTAWRASRMLQQGTTTIEVKSGYGLDVDAERKMLKAIQNANGITPADLVPTCLAAHIKPRDFEGSAGEYLDYITSGLLPLIKAEKLTSRVDIYVDEGAFDRQDAVHYLSSAKELGFEVVVHADQFKPGGALLAVEIGARSADHLEASSDNDIRILAGSDVMAVVLPGASLGLGVNFAPARKLLDAGAALVIASDWNPGSAPMGSLLMQACILGAHERLTMTETLAALTCRAAATLGMNDRGILRAGMLADFVAFPCSDYREIIYNQGGMGAVAVWKRGKRL
jgi:imidazolonepropionase